MAAAIEIPKEDREWLDGLKSLCVSDMVKVKSYLQRALEASRNCFDFVLYVIKHADFDGGKKSLAYVTLVEFETWLKSKTEGRDVQEVKKLGYWPSESQKELALELVMSSNFLLFELVRRTFQLDSADISFLTKHVKFLIHTRREYKEAATIAYKLRLQRYFKVTEILLPLIIVNKWPVAESYVEGCPTSLQLFMELINNLCSRTDDELEGVVEETVASKPKDHKFKKKSLVKAGERLVKRFQLKAENYPNIYREKSLEALKNLLQRKYLEEKQLTRKWEDVIKSTLGDDKWLQLKLIEGLVEFHDIKEAAKWTRRYRLPLEFVDPLVKDFVESGQGASEDSEDWEAEIEGVYNDISSTPERCYRLPLSTHRIFMVDNSKSFRECAQVLCKVHTVLYNIVLEVNVTS